MERKVEECKKCGNHVVGTPQYDSTRRMTRNATKVATNSGLKWILSVVGLIIGGIFGLGIGAIPGAIGGYLVGCLFGNTTDNVVNAVDESLYNSTSYSFDCPKCGNQWIHELSNTSDTTSDTYLQAQKDRRVKKYEDAAGGGKMQLVFSLISGLLALWYWNTHTMHETLWVCLLLIGAGVMIIAGVIGFFSGLSGYLTNKEKADNIRKMSLSDYRFSKERYES